MIQQDRSYALKDHRSNLPYDISGRHENTGPSRSVSGHGAGLLKYLIQRKSPAAREGGGAFFSDGPKAVQAGAASEAVYIRAISATQPRVFSAAA